MSKKKYFGVETEKSIENFNVSGRRLPKVFIKAMSEVKQACAETNVRLGYLDKRRGEVIISVCEELSRNNYDDQIVVDVYQGGAGTSTNMNFNEVIAGLANEKLDEEVVHAIHHVNLHQSTNDVYPTALRVSILYLLKSLELELQTMQEVLQEKELEFRDVVKLGRTQLQDAVPMTLGMEFGAWGEAIARDRWRVFKSRERIKQINLGGTAIGTGLTAPREYIFKVTEQLRKITGLSIARAENLVDATQNLDPIVEISGMLKTLGVNLFKISQDIRFLSSGPMGGLGEIKLPELQKGSSIMPGKVNPVMPEMIGQVSLKVMNNDTLISQVAALGNLELNQFLPLLTITMLESMELLINSIPLFCQKCLKGITANDEVCLDKVKSSGALATVLINRLGYTQVEALILEAGERKKSLEEVILEKQLLSEKELKELLSPAQMYKLGF
ncbi:MAG: aspartate ammonia-lyase [Candidatus Stygibacter australis]|nr:aspartate ammonia-lyase [Candidatus Stygibacter australis]MDP8321155.1 aspartate ammonia-lyase [Candidatus Stygibacter australis]